MNDLISQHIEALNHGLIDIEATHGPALGQVAARTAGALLEGGRVFTMGSGQGITVAQLLATNLNSGLNRDRPGLPATCLNQLYVDISAMGSARGGNEAFGQVVRNNVSEHDVLFIVSQSGNERRLFSALQAAHERDLGAVLLTGQEGSLSSIISHDDQEINVSGERFSDILCLQFCLVNLLTELIEESLFGNNL